MAPHVSHTGVHDHGFNNISTYGNLLAADARRENSASTSDEKDFYELALKVSGAVQAARWTTIADGTGYHLLVSTAPTRCLWIRCARCRVAGSGPSARPCAAGANRTQAFPCCSGCSSTRKPRLAISIYYGEGRDAYDVRGRTAHESIFNSTTAAIAAQIRSKVIRPSARGRAVWLGNSAAYAEQLEFLATVNLSSVAQTSKSPRIAGFQTRKRSPCRLEVGDTAGLEAALHIPRGRPSHGGLLSGQLLRGRHSDVGHGRPQSAPPGALPRASRPIRSTAGSQWTAQPPQSRRRAWSGWGIIFWHRR